MDLLLSNPITRGRVVLQKFAATVIGIAGLSLVLWLVLVVGTQILDMDVSFVELGAIITATALMALQVGALALAVGAATGKKGVAVAAGSVVATIAFLLHTLAPEVEGLEGARYVSSFHYMLGGDPLANGFQLLDLGVLTVAAALAVVVAIVTFDRRDLAV